MIKPNQVALVFPGQGAQKVGMGKEFYETSPQAKAVFDQANEILGYDLKSVIFDGPEEKLKETAFTQPGILTMSYAAFKTFEANPKYKKIKAKYAAGLSLGEYSALTCAKAMSFENCLRLVERRGAFMEEAAKKEAGKMAAIIGLDKQTIETICRQTGAQIANYNSPQQIVITGHAKKVEEACKLLKEAEAKSIIELNVSGAFHSTLMQSAVPQFQQELIKVKIDRPKILILSNVDATDTGHPDIIWENLWKQITSPVRWVEIIQNIAGKGVTTFIEIGPGDVLKGLIRRINREFTVYNIQTPADIEALPF